jgi:hypothetical protein
VTLGASGFDRLSRMVVFGPRTRTDRLMAALLAAGERMGVVTVSSAE